jgi:hypothetical protein
MKHAVVIPLSDPRAAELKDCGTERDGRLVIDRDGECYKTWRRRSRGLGDTIAKITSAVGIKACGGCKKRQARLNELVPYRAD